MVGILLCTIVSAQTTTFDYANASLGSACNVFNPAVNINSVSHSSWAGGVNFTSQKGIGLSVIPSGQKGTAFLINYNFLPGYDYEIVITTIEGDDAVYLNTSVLSGLSSYPTTSSTSCSPDEKVGLYAGGSIGHIFAKVPAASKVHTVPTFSIPGNTAYPYLLVWINGGQAGFALDYFLISKIEIKRTAQTSFTLSPTSVSVPCGSTTAQTFTVTNGNNTPNVTYEWNLGSASNGWMYNGSPAPQILPTTGNSVSLSPSGCSSSLSNVAVTVKINGANFQTLTATSSITLPAYSISGKSIICNSETYTLNGDLPCGATVSWSIPQGTNSVLQFSPNPPTGQSITITNRKWYGLTTTLTATISLPCSPTPITVTKNIANDNEQSLYTTYSYSQEACVFEGVSHPAQSGTITTNSSPVFVHQGCTVSVNLGSLGAYHKTVTFHQTSTSSVSNPIFWYFNGTHLVFQLPLGSGGIPFTFKITGDGACYTEKTLLFFSYGNNTRTAPMSSYTFDVAPNPVKNMLTIAAKKEHKESGVKGDKPAVEELLYSFNIYDANINALLLSQKDISNPVHQVNVSNLRIGWYILQIVQGGQEHTIKFLKE